MRISVVALVPTLAFGAPMASAKEPAAKLIFADQFELVRNLLDASGQQESLKFDVGFPNFAGGPAILETIRAGAGLRYTFADCGTLGLPPMG